MRVAAFREHPHASAVAGILADQGYDTEIVALGGTEYDPRARDLCEAIRDAAWANAFLISNCELDHFERIVNDNYGDVVFHHRPLRHAC
ncbi:MAG: hypothetical protein JO192_13680 [Candidatus Eremiobacteraeota bacterium]|nr:hypothetical protein [Candidatus Eremiobacteraeota bacterium]